MSLEPSYLQYPKRRLGYDHDLYPWSKLSERTPMAWPDGKSVATFIVVSVEWFPIIASDFPFRAPGHMQTPYPDYRHYTSREYGTRVGFYRLLDIFAKASIKVSVAVNAAIAERYPGIIRDLVSAGHEIIAHSTDMNGTIATGLAQDAERTLILRSLDALQMVSGRRPKGWLSIARSQSWNTHQLLVEAGLEYCCDWANDELPYRFNNGLINIPLNHELSDRQIITVQQQSIDSYAEQILDAHDWLTAEAAAEGGGRMLPLHITPYIVGLPYRVDAFQSLMSRLAAKASNGFLTGAEIAAALPLNP